jgi:hypothetical protein
MRILLGIFIAVAAFSFGGAAWMQYQLNIQLNERIAYLEHRSYEQDTDLINLYEKFGRLDKGNTMILDFFQGGGFEKTVKRIAGE